MAQKRPEIEIFGDAEGVEMVSALIRAHGWKPRPRGGLDVAPKYEGGVVSFGKIFGNLKREIMEGEKLSVLAGEVYCRLGSAPNRELQLEDTSFRRHSM